MLLADCCGKTLAPSGEATENVGVENAIRAKLQGWKMQEWKMQELIEGVENAGVNHMEHQPEIILRKPQVTSLDLSLFF